jgi:NADH dehydrogenase/NADH:ubiquinone oxidoreductase subunit G
VPTAVIAEKGGSLTTFEGRIQSFSPVLQTRGDAVPEWRALINLGRRLGIRFADYGRFHSPEDVYLRMSEEIPFFRK